MSRRAPRYRAQLTCTVTPLLGDGALLVCRTRDISTVGLALDTNAELDPGTRLVISILDQARGAAFEVTGEVSRHLSSGAAGVGVLLIDPPDDWDFLVADHARRASGHEPRPAKRMRVLVVGDDHRRRGALALYVTSGWDVRFASDLDGASEAMREIRLDAVIAEHDFDDPAWEPLLSEVRRAQPSARRIVRGAIAGAQPAPLVHRFVDREAGLDALLDALTADFGAAT